MKISAWILASALFFSIACSGSDKEEFKSDILQGYSATFCGREFLGCLNLEHEVCIKYINEAAAECPFDQFFEAVSNRSVEGVKNKGRAYGMCVSKTLFSKANLPEETVLKCHAQLPK